MELLPVNQIRVDVDAPDWQSAVRATGRILVDNDLAEEGYIEAMVNMVEELGPYIVMTPGIAIPHARPEEGAKAVGFAAVKLAAPICFGNEFNDPVYLVLGFCSPNAQAHVELLAKIAEALETENLLERIKSAKTPVEIAALFNG
ncbi:MAG: PTS sugar transporter subunit IIA [Anaerolineaceae bacterium]|jgi:mannitol/fructose-specific phosphotransferase system IIA component (Ntr-type)|nr:PTS sugar transporter subunit IIA [Anaerolineaceae bacterium]